ncbi:hypothetical protein CTAYLR_006424 [Chrysophaeum taylorii]|uniref:Pseudouridine synthase RsuA/RluA-like domain-containing protein n=1 Tax=Chrysophaeum taylorii TaxID=2483200 RepID=A0AAD7UAF5_9STRA|nr:hypothetical protein CTAYLR_006424 [Chrysophaeum taylorii]
MRWAALFLASQPRSQALVSWHQGAQRSDGGRWAILEEEADQRNVVYIGDVGGGSLVGDVARGLGSSEERARALVEIGAVWWRSCDESGRWRRVWSTELPAEATALRVYPRPRRFEACYCDWSERLCYVDSAYVVVDKPPMLPTQADNGNSVECVAACVSRHSDLGILRPAHRLDAVVGGCLVLARNRKALAAFEGWTKQRRVSKYYVALTTVPVRERDVDHDMLLPATPEDREKHDTLFGPGPRLVRPKGDADDRGFSSASWKPCKLKIIERSKHVAGSGFYETRLRLVTGRPHQIRAQFAAIGAELVGDTLYAPGPLAVLWEDHVDPAALAAARRDLSAPTAPIGLSARAISFAGRDIHATLAPWWRA